MSSRQGAPRALGGRVTVVYVMWTVCLGWRRAKLPIPLLLSFLKSAKHHPTDTRRRVLRVTGTARRSNQPILKDINPESEELMLKLKLQYSGHLMGTD